MQDLSTQQVQVLIASDSGAVRQAIGGALALSGLAAECREAESPAEAWAILEQHVFDAALVCFGDAGGGSARFAADTKARALPTPLILITNADAAAGKEVSGGAGEALDAIPLSKVSPEGLERAVRNARRLSRAQGERHAADTARAASEARWSHVADSPIMGIAFWEADGQVSDGNDTFLAMVGRTRAEMEAGTLHSQALTPPEYWGTDGSKLEEMRRIGTCTPWEKEFQRPDGTRVAVLVSATLLEPSLGKGMAFMVDVTEPKRARDAKKFLAQAGEALSQSPRYTETLAQVARLAAGSVADWCAIDLVEEGKFCRIAAAHGPAITVEEAATFGTWLAPPGDTPGGPAQCLAAGRATMTTAGSAAPPRLRAFACAPVTVRERVLGTAVFAYAHGGRDQEAQGLEVAEQLGQRIGLAVDNARFLFQTQARAEREAVVNAIGQALRASLDQGHILASATKALGEALGTSRCFWCWTPRPPGQLSVAAQQHSVPGLGGRAHLGVWEAPLAEWMRRGASGVPLVVSGSEGGGGEAGALLACAVLLRGDGGGVLAVEQADAARSWTPSEVELVCQVGALLGPALENARLYEREHRVADMLQAAFLSDIPDQLAGLELATVYRAGLDESQVGGDCYDVFSLPDGRVALLIADVSGKGLSAAVVTATVKFSLRAFAAEVSAPALVLTRLNRLLCGEASGLGEHFVTLFYAVFDPNGGRLIYAGAGHETQLIKRVSGECTALESTGPILGISEHVYEQREERLERGDALVLFTDGLSEARNPQTRELLDISRIAHLLSSAPRRAGAGALTASLEALARQWAQGRPHDDMALLVARRAPAVADDDMDADWSVSQAVQHWEENEVASGEAEYLFRLTFPSRAGHAADVRQAVAHWMETLGYNRDARDGFLTAVTEAVTNAVVHGSPAGEADEFSVAARASAQHLSVEVVDRGPGLHIADTSPPMPGPEAIHGRGLPLMREFTNQVEYLPTGSGLCVRLHTCLMP